MFKMVILDLKENTGVKRPGRTEKVDKRAIVKNDRAEEVLRLHKSLVRLRIGTNQVEREAENIKSEGS